MEDYVYIKQLAVRLAEELDELEQGSGFAQLLAMSDNEIIEEVRGLKEKLNSLKTQLRGIF